MCVCVISCLSVGAPATSATRGESQETISLRQEERQEDSRAS